MHPLLRIPTLFLGWTLVLTSPTVRGQFRGQSESAEIDCLKRRLSTQRYLPGILEASQLLSQVYAGRDDREALRYFQVATTAKDSLFSQEKTRQFMNLDFEEQRQQEVEAARTEYQNRQRTYGLVPTKRSVPVDSSGENGQSGRTDSGDCPRDSKSPRTVVSANGKGGSTVPFNIELLTDFDPAVDKVTLVPQEIGRVLLNLYSNAFYAVQQKQRSYDGSFTN